MYEQKGIIKEKRVVLNVAYANLSIKMDKELKAEADRLFNEMGMTLSTAVNIFVRQAMQEKAIPFKVFRNEKPQLADTTTMEQRRIAMEELREMFSCIDGTDADTRKIRANRRAEKHGSID